MKILLCSTAALPTPTGDSYGGIENVITFLAEGLSDLGHEVGIIGLEGSGPTREKIKVYIGWRAQEKYSEILLANDDRGPKIIENFKPDIISDASHEKRLFPIAKKMGIPYIPNSHTIAIPDLGETKPCWTALSNSHAQWLNKKYGVSPRVCYNGITVSEGRAIVNHKAKIGSYIFVGRPNPEKGALEVVTFCRKNNLPLDVIAGRLEIEPVAYAMLVAQNCKWGSKQVYHGGVPLKKKMQMFAQSKAFLFFPHWAEPFGLTPVEAGYMGTPSIVTDMGAMPEIVEDGKTGFIIPVKKTEAGEPDMAISPYGFYVTQYDEQKVLDAIHSVGSLDLEYIARKTKERFSAKAMAEQYLKVFEAKLNGESW